MAFKKKAINLALQGGGSHGAFSWGVLDRLLDEPRLAIEGISGTSAGAMNAVAVADGMMVDGPAGARAALDGFWEAVAEAATISPIRRTPLDMFMGNWSLDLSPGYLAVDLLGRVASPYDLNPTGFNPLRPILEDRIDFDRVRSCDRVKVFISATNVRTGRVKVFDRKALTAETVLASAALPQLFHAIEIDGEAYWDGGYMGNPVLFPFFRSCATRDIVIVQINPIERAQIPRTAREIQERVNEITFNASLLREFRAIDFVARLLDTGSLDETAYHRMFVHRIDGDGALEPLGASSKLNAERAFLHHLKAVGQGAADRWLAENFDRIGKEATLDLRALFQGDDAGRGEA